MPLALQPTGGPVCFSLVFVKLAAGCRANGNCHDFCRSLVALWSGLPERGRRKVLRGVFASLACDPGLDQLLPYLRVFVTDKVAGSLKDLSLLSVLLQELMPAKRGIELFHRLGIILIKLLMRSRLHHYGSRHCLCGSSSLRSDLAHWRLKHITFGCALPALQPPPGHRAPPGALHARHNDLPGCPAPGTQGRPP
eukprot:scaffold370883_cov33-Prasinocladus_malaysianus.AAC.1